MSEEVVSCVTSVTSDKIYIVSADMIVKGKEGGGPLEVMAVFV